MFTEQFSIFIDQKYILQNLNSSCLCYRYFTYSYEHLYCKNRQSFLYVILLIKNLKVQD